MEVRAGCIWDARNEKSKTRKQGINENREKYNREKPMYERP